MARFARPAVPPVYGARSIYCSERTRSKACAVSPFRHMLCAAAKAIGMVKCNRKNVSSHTAVFHSKCSPRTSVGRIQNHLAKAGWSQGCCLCPNPLLALPDPLTRAAYSFAFRDDQGNLPILLERERQTRRDEIAIDMEDRSTKKGTPPVPSESGDIRDLRRTGAAAAPSPNSSTANGQAGLGGRGIGAAPMVE